MAIQGQTMAPKTIMITRFRNRRWLNSLFIFAAPLSACAIQNDRSSTLIWRNDCIQISQLKRTETSLSDHESKELISNYLLHPAFPDSHLLLPARSYVSFDSKVFAFDVKHYSDTEVVFVMKNNMIVDKFITSSWKRC